MKSKWFSFYPKFTSTGFRLCYYPYWYFDERPVISSSVSSILFFCLIPILGVWSFVLLPMLFFSWGEFFIHLPIKTGKEESDYPDYSIQFYSVNGEIPNHIWIGIGKKRKIFRFPWYKDYLRSMVLLEDDSWVEESDNDRTKKLKKTVFNYEYVLKNGDKQYVTASVSIEKMFWVSWFGLNITCDRFIDVVFSSEIGEGVNSWKGGVVGCSYLMRKGEDMHDTLLRMQEERKFK